MRLPFILFETKSKATVGRSIVVYSTAHRIDKMVQTTKMMINSIGEVANLMGRDEWGMGFISH